MLFTSLQYALFLLFIYIIYWGVLARYTKGQNWLILFGSYFFYAQWDYRFLGLLIISTLLNFLVGELIYKNKWEKGWMIVGLMLNLGILGLFKYFNFFITSFHDLATHLGLSVNVSLLNVILPIGISFYTFHGLSYILDIYYKRIQAEKSFLNYSIFTSFFPLLIAGPIERATTLLPQVKRSKHLDYSKHIDGLRQILWGLFKKIVIADNCAYYANQIFSSSDTASGSSLLWGAFCFSIQIYADFSAYSDIATGSARLLGYDLIKNFNYPYFSRDIAEFWRRWHISLSSWFRDYVYIPLGGSACGRMLQVRNTFIIFIISGFWHGANWTFIIWGVLNALYILPLMLLKSNRNNLSIVAAGRMFPSLYELFQMILTFFMAMIGWIFFRAETVMQGVHFIQKIFSPSILTLPEPRFLYGEFHSTTYIVLLLIFFFSLEWIGREKNYAIESILSNKPRVYRFGFYYCLIFLLIVFSSEPQEFIYFQF